MRTQQATHTFLHAHNTTQHTTTPYDSYTSSHTHNSTHYYTIQQLHLRVCDKYGHPVFFEDDAQRDKLLITEKLVPVGVAASRRTSPPEAVKITLRDRDDAIVCGDRYVCLRDPAVQVSAVCPVR